MGDINRVLEESRAAHKRLLRAIADLARVQEELHRNLRTLGTLIPRERWAVVHSHRRISALSDPAASPTRSTDSFP